MRAHSSAWVKAITRCSLVLVAAIFAMALPAHATDVVWSGSGGSPTAGQLDATMLPTSTGTAGYRYTNVNNEGYDIVVTTSGINQDGPDTYNSLPTWWMGGQIQPDASLYNAHVTFDFYQTGTTTPIGVDGIHFTFEDAEVGERFQDFQYSDYQGVQQTSNFADPSIFTYSYGLVTHLSNSSYENNAPNEPGTQTGKTIDVNMANTSVSEFSFRFGRQTSSAGSFIMTALGNLSITGGLLIQSGSDQNMTGSPNFVSTAYSSQLTPTSIQSALATSNATITTGTSQNILINSDISSGSGNSLTFDPVGKTVQLNANVTYTNDTHIASGTLDMNGNSMANSALYIDGTSSLTVGNYTANNVDTVAALNLSSSANLNMKITSSSINDTLGVTGQASLDGLYTLSVGSGFNPVVGDSYQVMTYGSSTGTFRSYTGLRLSSTIVLQPTFSGSNMILTAQTVSPGTTAPLTTIAPGGSTTVTSGSSYAGITTTSTLANATTVTLLDGTASTNRTVSINFSGAGTFAAANGGTLVSDLIDFSGTVTDKFVMQIDYNEASLPPGTDESQLFVAWLSGSGVWENAVYGNSDGGATQQKILGAYDPSTDFVLGDWGVDTINNRVWAVVDHNSTYAVGGGTPQEVPEPSSVALLCTAGLSIFGARRYLRRRTSNKKERDNAAAGGRHRRTNGFSRCLP